MHYYVHVVQPKLSKDSALINGPSKEEDACINADIQSVPDGVYERNGVQLEVHLKYLHFFEKKKKNP